MADYWHAVYIANLRNRAALWITLFTRIRKTPAKNCSWFHYRPRCFVMRHLKKTETILKKKKKKKTPLRGKGKKILEKSSSKSESLREEIFFFLACWEFIWPSFENNFRFSFRGKKKKREKIVMIQTYVM